MGLALDEPEADDERAEVNGVAVAVRPADLSWVQGAQVDYIQDGLREGFLVSRGGGGGDCGDGCGDGCC